MKLSSRVASFVLAELPAGGSVVLAGTRHDRSMDAAQKMRDAAADNETDPDARQRDLDQADAMERNARALESTAPVFVPGDSIQDSLNQQLRNLERQRQEMQQQGHSERRCNGVPPCAWLAPQ